MQPLVSAIIPTCNSAQYIKDALESVFNQTYKNVEVIVVDDGSNDNTKDVLKPYLDRIRYIYKENGGPASARNLGIKNARGQYIAFLDSDDTWLPTKLETQVNVFKNNDDIELVSCGKYMLDSSGTITACHYAANYENKEKLLQDLVTGNFSGGGSRAIVRKRCFDKIGLFDESLKGTEDWDMWLRIARDFEIRFVEKPLVNIRTRQDSVSSARNAGRMLKGDLKVVEKHYSQGSTLRTKLITRRKAYSYCYLRAAISYLAGDKRDHARKCILTSILTYPFILLRLEHIGLAIRIISGDGVFNRIKDLGRFSNRNNKDVKNQ